MSKALTRRPKQELASQANGQPKYARQAEWLLADVSGSMESYEGAKRRIDYLNDAIAQQPLSTQILAFNHGIVHTTQRSFNASGDTCLIPALTLVKDYEPTYVLVISDGNINDNHERNLALAQEIYEAGAVIDTLYIGPDDKYAIDFLTRLAQAGGGRFRRYEFAQAQAQLGSAVQGFLPAGDDIVEL